MEAVSKNKTKDGKLNKVDCEAEQCKNKKLVVATSSPNQQSYSFIIQNQEDYSCPPGGYFDYVG